MGTFFQHEGQPVEDTVNISFGSLPLRAGLNFSWSAASFPFFDTGAQRRYLLKQERRGCFVDAIDFYRNL